MYFNILFAIIIGLPNNLDTTILGLQISFDETPHCSSPSPSIQLIESVTSAHVDITHYALAHQWTEVALIHGNSDGHLMVIPTLH